MKFYSPDTPTPDSCILNITLIKIVNPSFGPGSSASPGTTWGSWGGSSRRFRPTRLTRCWVTAGTTCSTKVKQIWFKLWKLQCKSCHTPINYRSGGQPRVLQQARGRHYQRLARGHGTPHGLLVLSDHLRFWCSQTKSLFLSIKFDLSFKWFN